MRRCSFYTLNLSANTSTRGSSQQVITSLGGLPVAFASGEGRACLTLVSEGFDNTASVKKCWLYWMGPQPNGKVRVMTACAGPVGLDCRDATPCEAPGACGPIMTHSLLLSKRRSIAVGSVSLLTVHHHIASQKAHEMDLWGSAAMIMPLQNIDTSSDSSSVGPSVSVSPHWRVSHE